MLQNYNKISIKRAVFSIILEKTQIKTSTKKNPHILRTPIFHRPK